MKCVSCGNDYSSLSQHWAMSSCEFPRITERQHEILTGLLMGDGSVCRSSVNPHFECKMVADEFLGWLDSEFGELGRGVRFHKTAEEQAEMNRKSGQSPNAEEGNYSDVYRWRTRTHPSFRKYADWYSSGKKRFPDDIELTPTILKVWYCCDGNIAYREDRIRPRLRISCTNELHRKDFIRGLFGGFGVVPWLGSSYVVFSCDDSEKIWDYMGESLPDFEYKWPE